MKLCILLLLLLLLNEYYMYGNCVH